MQTSAVVVVALNRGSMLSRKGAVTEVLAPSKRRGPDEARDPTGS